MHPELTKVHTNNSLVVRSGRHFVFVRHFGFMLLFAAISRAFHQIGYKAIFASRKANSDVFDFKIYQCHPRILYSILHLPLIKNFYSICSVKVDQ